jgi:hypothetical protein
MLVMFAYVSLSPARNEIFAGLVDCRASLGEVTHFGKTFGYSHGFFLKDTAINMVLLKTASPIVVL